MSILPQPGNDFHKIRFRHRRAASGWPVFPASNVKKYGAAIARNWRIGIVADFD
jgi:hypothetical protein